MTSPTVEMLWSDDDPLTVLRERFHHTDGQRAAHWLSDIMRDEYGITVEGCSRLVMSDQNALAWMDTPRGPMVAKWCVAPERFPRLAQLAHLTTWLAAEGIPVSEPVRACDGEHQIIVDRTSFGLQHVIDGDLLEVDDLVEVRALGAELARLHEALARYPGAAALVQDRGIPWAQRMHSWVASLPAEVPATVRGAIGATFPEVDVAPREQLLHGDVRSANVLCRSAEVVAFLDFEEARRAPAVDELARAAVMLGTRFRDWAPVDPGVHDALRNGYESVRPFDRVERAWWRPLVLLYSAALVPPGDDVHGWAAAARRLAEGTCA